MQTQTATPQTATPTPIPATSPVVHTLSHTAPCVDVSSLAIRDTRLSSFSPDSTWIERVSYIVGRDGRRFLAFHLAAGRALLYSDGARQIPSWLPGLLAAGRVGDIANHGTSTGRAYNRFMRGNPNYTYQSVSATELNAVLSTAKDSR